MSSLINLQKMTESFSKKTVLKFNKSAYDKKKLTKNYPGITDVCQWKRVFTESPIGLELNMTIEHCKLMVLGQYYYSTASNLCLLLQKEQNVKGGEGPSGKQAVGINNGTR